MPRPAKKAIGTIEWKNGKTWHTGWITEVEEECSPDMFIRYQTDMMLGLMEPLMKVNVEIKRCYFLTERSANGDITFAEYENKGYPCKIHLY
jgi:hypothetical protein